MHFSSKTIRDLWLPAVLLKTEMFLSAKILSNGDFCTWRHISTVVEFPKMPVWVSWDEIIQGKGDSPPNECAADNQCVKL